jgi:hypothetical protein
MCLCKEDGKSLLEAMMGQPKDFGGDTPSTQEVAEPDSDHDLWERVKAGNNAALAQRYDRQAELVELEALFGDMAMTVEPLPPTPVLRQRVLASVEPTTLFEGFSDRFAEMFDINLEKARTLLRALNTSGILPVKELITGIQNK